ncbi:hypothetical protein RDABS01_007388 [Bienertia sinuspersici]
MAETMEPENAAFWLPTHFLTDDDFLSDDIKKTATATTTTNHRNFDVFSSLDSPVSSTETELGDSNTNEDALIDDDDFLAELTRHLAVTSNSTSQKPWLFSTSPQSTLSGFGPWSNRSGFSSNGSPNGPSRAAGQVARLKINALAAQFNHHNHQQQQQQNRGLLAAPAPRNVSLNSKSHHHHLNSFYDYPQNPTQLEQVKRQGSGNFYCQHHNHHQRRSCGGGPLGLPQSAWPPLRPNHHRQPTTAGPGMRAVFLNGPGTGSMPAMKRQSAGTGVFLPRRAGTTHQQPPPPPESRKKPNGNSTVLFPARVVQALNLDFDDVNNGVNNANSHSRFGTGMLSDHDILLARRNAILEQQRRNNLTRNEAMVGHEIRLPTDWTY